MALRSLLTLAARVVAGLVGAALIAWGFMMLIRAVHGDTDNGPVVTAALGGLALFPGGALLWLAFGKTFAAWSPADE